LAWTKIWTKLDLGGFDHGGLHHHAFLPAEEAKARGSVKTAKDPVLNPSFHHEEPEEHEENAPSTRTRK
jgi:hypothetical protein